LSTIAKSLIPASIPTFEPVLSKNTNKLSNFIYNNDNWVYIGLERKFTKDSSAELLSIN
jgi:hypothetical protein